MNFGAGRRSYVSIVTDAPGGFDDAHLAAFEQLLPALETRLELESTRSSMGTLLEVYFKRGTGQLSHAGIWPCDLRGFPALTDRLPVQEVVTDEASAARCRQPQPASSPSPALQSRSPTA